MVVYQYIEMPPDPLTRGQTRAPMRLGLMPVASVLITSSEFATDTESTSGTGSDAKAIRADTLQADSRRAVGRGQGCRFLGPRSSRVRGAGLPVGTQDLCRPEPRARRPQARVARPARRTHRRAGAQAGGRRDRPHQAGRGSGFRAAQACSHRGGPGGTLHGGACDGELQCAHPGHLPGIARQPHSAGTGNDGNSLGRPVGGGGAPLPTARHPPGRRTGR